MRVVKREARADSSREWQLDLRLNPVVKQESYRLFAIKYLPRLRRLDGRDITATERTRADCLFANLDCSRLPPSSLLCMHDLQIPCSFNFSHPKLS